MPEHSNPIDEFSALWRATRPDLDSFVRSTAGLSTRQLVDLVSIDQRERWNAGERVAIDEYFRRYPQLRTDPTLAADLVYGEYLLHEERDGTSVEAELARRFPDVAATLRAQVELHHALSVAEPPDAGDPLPRQFGRYEIQRQLGRGGMGTVYLARDSQLNRLVALKVPLLAGDSKLERQFLREAQAAAALQHPSTCPVYDFGQIDGRHFITMAYLEGESLSMRLARGRLPVNEAIELARTIADALAEAHRAGIVHRDLKPANILFDRNGRPVVADFGLSRNVALAAGDSLTGQSIVGTPAYMSPEQINGETDRIGPPTDVYALGVVLYEMLTGARPFEGSLGTLLGKIATADPSSPSELRPEIDERLNAICLRALARSPSERFQTMTEFSSALGEAAGPASRRKQVTRRLALAGSLGLVLVGVIVAVIALSRDPTGSPNAQPVDPVNPPVIAAPKGNLRLLVPAYFSPTGSGAVHWDSLIRTASSNHIVIINVDDGPGSNADANWARVIERLQSAGATAIGYVGTNYGKVSLARVKRHIDDWHRFYPAIGGIFFEEQAATAGRADYYVQAAKHARAKNAKSLVVSNPGDHCDRAYFECRDIDIVCVIESGKEYHLELPDWMPRDFPDKLAGMIYEVDSARRMEERMAELTAGGVRSLYLSDTKEDEHFSRLPPWWNELVQAAAK